MLIFLNFINLGISDITGYNLCSGPIDTGLAMKRTRNDTEDSEFFLDLLKDQFVFFYALTNVIIEAYKKARKNYNAEECMNSSKEKEAG